MQTYELTVVIERDEDGRYLVICPALQGCYTEGTTEEEARSLIADAIRLHIESRIERRSPDVSSWRFFGTLGKGLLRSVMNDARLTREDLET